MLVRSCVPCMNGTRKRRKHFLLLLDQLLTYAYYHWLQKNSSGSSHCLRWCRQGEMARPGSQSYCIIAARHPDVPVMALHCTTVTNTEPAGSQCDIADFYREGVWRFESILSGEAVCSVSRSCPTLTRRASACCFSRTILHCVMKSRKQIHSNF